MDYKYFILFAGFFFSLLTAFAVYSWLSRGYRFSEIRTNLIAGWFPVCFRLSLCSFTVPPFMILSAA